MNRRSILTACSAMILAALFAAGCTGRWSKNGTTSITDARFVEPRQDLAWENDRIAFRVYGPALAAEVSNGVDVWSKRVTYPVIAKWYAGDTATGPAKRSYHVDHGEGADFFSVGRTLGCGGSSVRDGEVLVQPGVSASYRIISSGPARAQFELKYPPVRFRGREVREMRRVTLEAGQHLNRFEVTYDVEGEPIDIPFAIGLVKRKGVSSSSDETGHWISLFGPTNDDPVNGDLGMGAVLPGDTFRSIREEATHLLLYGEARSGTTVTYYAGAGWTRSGFVRDRDGWEAYVVSRARNLER